MARLDLTPDFHDSLNCSALLSKISFQVSASALGGFSKFELTRSTFFEKVTS